MKRVLGMDRPDPRAETSAIGAIGAVGAIGASALARAGARRRDRPRSPAGPAAPVRAVLAGQAPPPTHGQAVVNQLLAEGLYSAIELTFVPMRFSRSLVEIGRFRPTKLLELARVVGALRVHAARGRRDVLVYSVGFSTTAPIVRDTIVLHCCRHFYRRTVLHLHTAEPAQLAPGILNRLSGVVRAAYADADAVFRVAGSLPETSVVIGGARRIEVVENGIQAPPAVGRSNDDDPIAEWFTTILFLANLDPSKGTHQLVRAVARLVHGPRPHPDDGIGACQAASGDGFEDGTGERIEAVAVAPHGLPPLRVDVVGAAPSEEAERELRGIIEAEGMVDHVRLLGPRYGEAKWRALAAADVFCYPTLADAAPLVVLEALAAGLPVVTTTTGALPSIVEHGVTGFVVPPGDVDALADALREVICRPARRHEMSEAARRSFAERFTADAMRRRFEAALCRVAAGDDPPCARAPRRRVPPATEESGRPRTDATRGAPGMTVRPRPVPRPARRVAS